MLRNSEKTSCADDGGEFLNENLFLLGHTWPLFRVFSSVQTILLQIYVKNVHPLYGTVNRPSEHESVPITTRPGLPPNTIIFIFGSF